MAAIFFLSVVSICAVIYTSKLFVSLSRSGLSLTLTLFFIKLQVMLELFIPQTIWGDRIGLRPVKSSLTTAEIEQVYAWSRDEEILRSWGGAASTISLAEFRHQSRTERWRPLSDQRSFFIVTRAGEMIGRIRLYSINWARGEGEMGIFLDKAHWSKQYGREALELLKQYCFCKLPINRIYLFTFQENIRAQRSFAACGFRAIGMETRYYPSLGKHVENIQMEITRQDFQNQQMGEASRETQLLASKPRLY